MASSRSRSPRRSPKLIEQLSSFLPSPPLLLRSALLASVLLLSVAIALFAWIVFHASLRTGSMGGRERVWLQYGHYQAPYASIVLPSGKYDSTGGQLYDVQLEMTVPAVARNLDLGNFMVSLELRDQAGEALQHIARPGTLHHPAPPSLLALLSPTRLLGSLVFPSSHISSATTQRLTVPLLEGASLARKKSKTTEVFVRVGREDAHPSAKGSNGWTPGMGEVQVYEAWLSFSVRLSGLRYLTQYHPILLFLLFVPAFTLFELFAALVAWAIWLAYLKRPSEDASTAPAVFPPAPGFPGAVKQEESDEHSSLDLAGPSTLGVGPGVDPFARAARDDAEAARIARARALGVGGRVGMTEIEGSEATETESEEMEEMEETEEGTVLDEGGGAEAEGAATSEESWEGVEGEDIKDEEGTVGGSDTTRGTRSSFGPSLAGTSTTASTSRTTATESTSAGALRARLGAGRVEEEEEEFGGGKGKGKGKARAD